MNMKKVLVFCLLSFIISGRVNAQLFLQGKETERASRNIQEYDGADKHGPGSGSGGGGEVTPLGSGLLLLTGLAAGYVCFKRSRNED